MAIPKTILKEKSDVFAHFVLKNYNILNFRYVLKDANVRAVYK